MKGFELQTHCISSKIRSRIVFKDLSKKGAKFETSFRFWVTFLEQCVFEYFETTQSARLSPAKIFQKPYLEPMKTAFRQMIYPNLDINVPVFVGTGAQDTITPAQMQHGFVQSACLSGVEVRSETYDQADHFEALTASIASAEAFVNAIRSGQKLPSTCPG